VGYLSLQIITRAHYIPSDLTKLIPYPYTCPHLSIPFAPIPTVAIKVHSRQMSRDKVWHLAPVTTFDGGNLACLLLHQIIDERRSRILILGNISVVVQVCALLLVFSKLKNLIGKLVNK
jgi:hypothetical protein